MADEIKVNYVPVRVQDLEDVSTLGSSDKVLLARDNSNTVGYFTWKIKYEDLSS